jgi:hypothetical protein
MKIILEMKNSLFPAILLKCDPEYAKTSMRKSRTLHHRPCTGTGTPHHQRPGPALA